MAEPAEEPRPPKQPYGEVEQIRRWEWRATTYGPEGLPEADDVLLGTRRHVERFVRRQLRRERRRRERRLVTFIVKEQHRD